MLVPCIIVSIELNAPMFGSFFILNCGSTTVVHGECTWQHEYYMILNDRYLIDNIYQVLLRNRGYMNVVFSCRK